MKRDPDPAQLVFDLDQSMAERDKAIAKVSTRAGEPFMEGCLKVISEMELKTRVTGEDIRRACMKAGLVPHHPNAWGAVVRTALTRKLMFASGRHRKMRKKSSHARQTPIYVIWRQL